MEQEEEEYRTFLEEKVGDELKDLITVEPNLDILDDEKGEDALPSKAKGKKKKKKGKEASATQSREEENQEFLLKYVLLPSSIT
jgi:hypothetical protein